MYELPATYELEFGIRYLNSHDWLSISGPRGECTINCTSGANMVLCPPQWSKLGRTKSWPKSEADQIKILGFGNAKQQLQVLLWKDTGTHICSFLQNGMRRSELVSGPGRFSKALAFRSRLQWDSILPKHTDPLTCWKVRKPPELIHLWSYGRPNFKSWAFWSHNKLQVPVLAGTWEAWNMDMAVDQD